jgi:hypothetical protein
MRKWLSPAAAMVAMPVAINASVPPTDWKPLSYKGPGILCGESFTLRLESGETATTGFPSQGYIPTHVRSHGGSFGVISYSFSRPKLRKRLLSSSKVGRIYVVKHVIRGHG